MIDESKSALLALLEQALTANEFVRLVLGKPRETNAELLRVTARPVVLKGRAGLSFVFSHRTRDLTRNLSLDDGVAFVRDAIGSSFGHAHLFTTGEDVQLLVSRKGRTALRRASAASARSAAPTAHDREKRRLVPLARPFLRELGVSTESGELVPAMARKFRQINRFVEVLDHALDASTLRDAARIEVVDFGSGKGYLTFATHDHLRYARALQATVTGVELRPDMVELCNLAAQRLRLEGLHFEQGDIRSVVFRRDEAAIASAGAETKIAPRPMDIMIALHACDTATDHAIHAGVSAGAAIIVCAPCCHKELRGQLLSPHPLRPILKHGVHLGQQAEMLTDGLRALLLEACGYDTQVFEFVSLEHTAKNKMILAVKRAAAVAADAAWRQIDEAKRFYGIRDQCLERLLRDAQEAGGAAVPLPAG